MPRWVLATLIVAVVGQVVQVTWILWGASDYLAARDTILYCALFLPSIVLFAGRARLKDGTRVAWLLLTAATTSWLLSEVFLALASADNPAGPLWVQAAFLIFSPLTYLALALLLRAATPETATSAYLDGVIIALTVAALMVLFRPLSVGDEADLPDLLLALSYPTLDLLQLTLLVAALVVLGRAAGWAWWCFLAGSALIWFGDSYWLLGLSLGQTQSNSGADMVWPLGMLLMAVGAWLPLRSNASQPHLAWALPLLLTAAAFALIVYATFAPVPPLSVVLATGAVVAGALRSMGAFRSAAGRAHAQHLARTDELTGLTNRRGLMRIAGPVFGQPRALLLVDVDRFKQINDNLGHQAGDDVLHGLSVRFRALVGEGCVAARIGGDEFVFLLPADSTADDARSIAQALHGIAARPVQASGMDLQVELSIGIAVAPHHGSTLSDLMLAADRAMYRAKREHVSTQVYDPLWDGGQSGNLMVLQELRSGLERSEFTCYFQPQLDVLSNEIVAVEALVRWQHPLRGLLAAGEFLPLVEQTTLIRPLTDRILSISLQHLRQWDTAGIHLRLCVNISATSLLDRSLPLRLTELLSDHQIAAARLTLEITETALSGDEDRVRLVLFQLHEIGVEISIDDYGSGYSSLHQIGTMQAQELKLDREFVTGVGQRADLRSILAATVHLAHGLRLRMVAEGVESAADLDQVRLSGCDLAQGFYISKPLAAASLPQWLSQRAARRGDDRLRY